MTTGNITSYYYLGDRLVAMKEASGNVTYVHQDSLGGTNVMSDTSGALISSISYMPFGVSLQSQGNLGMDRLFTGQRLDGTVAVGWVQPTNSPLYLQHTWEACGTMATCYNVGGVLMWKDETHHNRNYA